jgi:hypothetical protein
MTDTNNAMTIKEMALKQLLKLQPCTSADLREACNWPDRQPANVLSVLRREGLAVLIDGENFLTDDGVKAANGETPLTRPAPPVEITQRPISKKAQTVKADIQKAKTALENIKSNENRKTGKPESRPRESFAGDYQLLERMIETFASAADDLKRIKNRLQKLDATTGQG